MTSTVLDGVLCLLLVSAAVVTVTTATPHEPTGEGRAADVASTLATTTASVNYTLTSSAETDLGTPADASVDRTAHGTLADHLARAAVARLSVDGRRLSRSRDGFVCAVSRVVGSAVRANHTRITAVWQPYRGAPVEGRITVGASPPPDVPVHTATMTVPSGFPSKRAAARDAAASGGNPAVADAVAAGVVDGLFPPTRTRIAAGSSPPASALVRQRYRRTERLLGVNRPATLHDRDVAAANDRLTAALSARFERDLSASNASARRVAAGVRLDRVRIVVRTWP